MNLPSSSLGIKVITGARRTEIAGFMADGSLKIKLNAKPIEGKANRELIAFLSKQLGISQNEIEIIIGGQSRRKVLKVSGIAQVDLQHQLEDLVNSQEP